MAHWAPPSITYAKCTWAVREEKRDISARERASEPHSVTEREEEEVLLLREAVSFEPLNSPNCVILSAQKAAEGESDTADVICEVSIGLSSDVALHGVRVFFGAETSVNTVVGFGFGFVELECNGVYIATLKQPQLFTGQPTAAVGRSESEGKVNTEAAKADQSHDGLATSGSTEKTGPATRPVSPPQACVPRHCVAWEDREGVVGRRLLLRFPSAHRQTTRLPFALWLDVRAPPVRSQAFSFDLHQARWLAGDESMLSAGGQSLMRAAEMARLAAKAEGGAERSEAATGGLGTMLPALLAARFGPQQTPKTAAAARSGVSSVAGSVSGTSAQTTHASEGKVEPRPGMNANTLDDASRGPSEPGEREASRVPASMERLLQGMEERIMTRLDEIEAKIESRLAAAEARFIALQFSNAVSPRQ